MTSVNDITGKKMQTGVPSDDYKARHDLVFNLHKVKEFYKEKVLAFHAELSQWEDLSYEEKINIAASYNRNR